MVNNKELILITTYCPTKEKKEILLEMLKSIQPIRVDYDVIVASHTTLDSWFFEYFDYFYFDKNNEILTDIEYRQNGWFQPFDNYVIWSSYMTKGNTISAIWNMLIPSISIAKSHGYQKIHIIEYDSIVKSDYELKENSKLLDNYSYVIYGNETTHKLVGAYMCFNINGMVEEWKSINNNVFEKQYFGKYPKVPENMMFDLIESQTSFFKKDYNVLEKNGIILNRVIGNPVNWNVPFYDGKTNKLKFLSKNNTNQIYDIKIIINDKFFNLGIIKLNTWKIVDLLDNFDNAKNLIVFKNDVKILELNFEDISFRDKFKHYNSALTNESLLKK